MSYNVCIHQNIIYFYLIQYQSTYILLYKYLLISTYLFLSTTNCRCQAVLVAALVSLATGQREDDFSCPDQHIGFYPHLYR